MSEQIFSFDTEQWKKLKELTKENAGSRGVSFCTDFTFCQNQTAYTQATIQQDASVEYSRINRHTDTSDAYTKKTPLVASKVKATYRQYSRTYRRDSLSDSRADYRQSNYSQGSTYSKRSSRYSRDYSKYTAYNQVSVCNDIITYTRVTKYQESTAFSANLPSVPILLGTEDGHIPVLCQTTKIALFSYDKDVDTSSDATLQMTYYDVYIQQIKDKYGIRVTGQPLIKIKSNVAEDSVGGGLTFDFDTTAYADGYYRIIAVARNAPKTMTFAISDDAAKTSESATYYMQDIATDSIVKNGEYDGVSLISGLTFGRGESNDPSLNANDKDVTTGYIYDMYSVSEIRIRQNHPAFFEAGIKGSTQTLNMIFAGLDNENIQSDETRGRYNASSKILNVYGTEEMAGEDDYISLRNWTKGVVASVEVTENNTDQWVEVIGELVNKNTGVVMPNSRIVAQFPTNKVDPNAYTHIVKSGGIGVKMQGYLYWPATLFQTNINTLKMEEYFVQMTVSEYTSADKATLIAQRTFSSNAVNDNGEESGEQFGFKVDIYEPAVTTNASWPENDEWITSIDINVQATDDQLKEVSIIFKDKNQNTLQTDQYSVSEGTIAEGSKNFNQTVSAAFSEFEYCDGVSVEVIARDIVGNTNVYQAASALNFDYSVASIEIDKAPKEDEGWYTTPLSPVVTIKKENGKAIEEIKILETTSPTAPALDDSSWLNIENPGREFNYTTSKIGQITGVRYVHVYVNDGLHAPELKTFGPYKVDLESPEVEISCDAIRKWQHQTTITAAINESNVGSKLQKATIKWYKSNGTVGGTVNKSYTTEYQGTVSLDIAIPDDSYDDAIYAEIIATDNAGNETRILVQNIYLDKTSPMVSVTPPASDYPNWVNESIDTTLTAVKENGAPIKSIEIAEVKDISNIADVPDDAWQSIAVGTGRNISHANQNIGQDSGVHYLYVRINNGIDTALLEYSFGPYKVDLINPEVASVDLNMNHPNAARWVEQYNRARWYWEPVEYRVFTKDDGGSKLAERKYQITGDSALIPTNDLNWINVPWENDGDNAIFVDIVNAGSNYIHTYLKDHAGNENNTNNRNSTEIKLDLDNPVLNLQQTFIGAISNNTLYGYVNYVLKASDATSGIKVVKYAVTDSPIPPDLLVVGDISPANLGQTNGWIDITDGATSAAGYEFNLKATGYSYVHVYAEDNAGRGLHTVPADVLSQTQLDTVDTTNPGVNIKPSYLIGLTVVDNSGKLVIADDSQAAYESYDNIYALKNTSSSATLKIDYHNYVDASTKLEINIIDKSTGNVVKTITDMVKFEIGDSADGAVRPYTTSVFWMDKNGQLLQSGLYEIQAKLYQEGQVASTVKTYIILKQNTLTNPVISSMLTGAQTDVDITFIEDTFLKDLALKYQSNTFIHNFITRLADSEETVYQSKSMATGSPASAITHTPVFVNNKWVYKTSVNKQTTFIATVTDAFGNQAQSTKTIQFNGLSYAPNVGEGGGSEGGSPSEIIEQSVFNVETPSANNYFIGFEKNINDEFKGNVFSFLTEEANSDPDESQ